MGEDATRLCASAAGDGDGICCLLVVEKDEQLKKKGLSKYLPLIHIYVN
jgi:hypothetical protein